MKKINTIFAGTSSFAVPSLKSLIKNDNFCVSHIITQPDKKIGRKREIIFSPIKNIALNNNIKILQPVEISEIQDNIQQIAPDIIVVASYGQIIPKKILDIPKYGCFNIHGSLLPKYRGASVIQAPILNNDKYTGVSIIKMDTGLDTGPIARQNRIILNNNENFKYLHDKLANIGGKMLPQTLLDYINKKIVLKNQDNKLSSYAPITKKIDGKINWNNDAKTIEAMIRALNPWPGTFSKIDDKILKIKKVENKILKINDFKIGELFKYENKLAIQCKKNALIVLNLQMEGKKEITTKQFLQGYQNKIGKILK